MESADSGVKGESRSNLYGWTGGDNADMASGIHASQGGRLPASGDNP
jgi:hypothetical protein